MKSLLQKFQRELVNRNYSARTIKIYGSKLKNFLSVTGDPYHCQSEIIADHLNNLKSPVNRQQTYGALKLFYKFVFKMECPYQLRSVRSSKKLPPILENEEIKKNLNRITNRKHQMLITMLYGSGLRVGEVVKEKHTYYTPELILVF